MDVEAQMDNLQEDKEVITPRVRGNSSGCKRPKVGKGSHGTGDSSRESLIHCRQGK